MSLMGMKVIQYIAVSTTRCIEQVQPLQPSSRLIAEAPAAAGASSYNMKS